MGGYYVKSGASGQLQGPLAPSQVRALVAVGDLQPDDLLSKDRRHWVAAAKVKGLSFPIDSPTASGGKQDPDTEHGCEPTDASSEPIEAPRSAAASGRTNDTANHDRLSEIAAGIAGIGLTILALSPMFRWINFGSGGIVGISGDGKIVLGVSVATGVVYAAAMFTKKRLIVSVLVAQAWATLAFFWMVVLIWKAATVFDLPDVLGNPFATMFATQVSPGAGLYLGLIGSLVVALALGFWAVRHLRPRNRLRLFCLSQTAALIFGVLLAYAMARESAVKSSDSGALSGMSGSLLDHHSPREEGYLLTSRLENGGQEDKNALLEADGALMRRLTLAMSCCGTSPWAGLSWANRVSLEN